MASAGSDEVGAARLWGGHRSWRHGTRAIRRCAYTCSSLADKESLGGADSERVAIPGAVIPASPAKKEADISGR